QPNQLPLTFGATESLAVGGPGGANNRFSMDKIKPLAGGDSVFTFKPSGSSGVVSCSTTYQTIYCTVPLEAMTKDRAGGRMSRTTFIGRALNWFGIQTFYKVAGEATAEAGLNGDAALLYQAFPNPFSGSTTTISFNLPAAGNVSLKVYNVAGQVVKTVCDEQRPAGVHKITWNGTDETGNKVSNGIYLYRLVANDQSQTKKLIVLR
ncbi:MAG: FlgD immunoglobulin-like domain containing protein, partial [Deltaproteobacteria bacterium]|nr:FlgD immunoglobulin-like domain containing protein [Deltaproteobacteria bacterium]